MKTGIIFFWATLILCSCHVGPKTYDEHLARLKQIVPQKALESEDEWLLKYGDFTGDGTDELVAFVYEETVRDEEIVYGQYYLCYGTGNRVSVCDTLYGGFYKAPEMFQAGRSTIMFYTIGYGGPSGESFCWKFADDGLVPVSMPGELNLIGDNCFKCSTSGFDSFRADGEDVTYSSGRCFYNYYYFFDGERFMEYGGKELSELQFSEIPGGSDLLWRLRSDGYTIENIYYRANGVVNINCSYRTEKILWPDDPPKPGTGYVYMELRLTADGFECDEGLQPGRIKAALTPEFALTGKMIQENYSRIKSEVKQIVADELLRIQNDPALAHLLQK